MDRFPDRTEAGRRLARLLIPWASANPVVVALPRGGVPIAFEIAQLLGAPLDVVIVRKLGVPQQPELAMGALGEDNVRVLNTEVVASLRIPELVIDDVTERASLEMTERLLRLRGERPAVDVHNRAIICVDDGIATGATVRAAIEVLRLRGATQVVVAAPVGARESVARLREAADDVVCLVVPDHFLAIGEWYDDFRQVSDEEVRRLLDRATESSQQPEGPSGGQAESDVTVEAGGVSLPGQLTVPRDAGGVVLFAHGSGSSRRSPRNFAIARHLNGSGVGTLLFDLLTDAESGDREKVFDIGLLATRLRGATDWVRTQLRQLPLGYFGASTGAAAALLAAASSGSDVAAVVSRGGRPDLAGPHLAEVRAPTLLIVGGADTGVLELNRAAQRLLRCENALEVVPGASHLFEEPGTLERVADLARDWFVRHLLGGAPQSRSSALLGHDERHLP